MKISPVPQEGARLLVCTSLRREHMCRVVVMCCVTCISLLFLGAPQLSAQCSPGGVNQIDANTFDMDMGQSIPATGTLQTCSHPFSLPSPGRILKIQGTVVFRGDCGGDTDTFVSVNGGAKQTYHMKQKLGTGGGVSTVFISYDIPLSYSSSNASIEFAAFVPSYCPSNPDWEFKGVMQIEHETLSAALQSNSLRGSKQRHHAERAAFVLPKRSR
jgi:hypothetical protein